MAATESNLVARAAAGDRAAFWELAAPKRGLMYAVAYGILRDPERAEDLLHDALIAAHKALPGLRDPEKLPAWLYGLTRRLALEALRREERLRAVRNEALTPAARIVPFREPPEQERRLEHMEAAMAELPEPFRVILALKYAGEMTCAEIAGTLEISVPAVKSRLLEARRLLRKLTERRAAREERTHG